MKLVTVVGARPQFIKLAPVTRALRAAGILEVIVHTGQHYDPSMSQVFFDQLEIPVPDHHLSVGSGTHGAMTGEMLRRVEEILVFEKPDWVMVYGDTNSTLAGALAAAKLNIPVAHVEAGLRSFNRRMPEEINRIVTDTLSTLLLCPTPTAVANLAREGISSGVHEVGDVMLDSLLHAATRARNESRILDELGLVESSYYLITLHRAENTDDTRRLESILEALTRLPGITVFPVHPRTRNRLQAMPHWLERLKASPQVRIVDPLSYIDMVHITGAARLVLTDSGGLQKEANWLGIPCVVLRDETEWVETLDGGRNVVAGADTGRILSAVDRHSRPADKPILAPKTGAADAIARLLSTL